MAKAEPNFALTGDKARILMAALRTSTIAVPVGTALELYIELAALSQVQPPSVQKVQEEKPNEG